MIVIDDHSTDGSDNLIKKHTETDSRIQLILNQENKGANFCRNEGLKRAKGRYLIFLDADDLLAPFCLEKRIETMKENPQMDFSVFPMSPFVYTTGDYNAKWIPNTKRPLADFLAHNLPWQTMQPIWDKRFLEKIGGFDETFSRLQDVELHTRALFTEGVQLLLTRGRPDCFYRIADDRLNFENFELLSRYVQSATRYYSKFFPLAEKRGLQNKLMGTIYRMYTRILYCYKKKKISNSQLQQLEKQLLNAEAIPALKGFKRTVFTAGKLAEQLPIRIPGINWTLSHLIEL